MATRTIDLDQLLGSVDSVFTSRPPPPKVIGKKCPDCDDGMALDPKDRLCRICGEELVDVVETPDAAALSQEGRGRDAMNFFDLLGDDLRAAIQASMAQSEPDRQISTEYLSKLGRVVLDGRRGLLYDVVVHVGPLTFMGTLATFGPIPQQELSATALFGDPENGDAPLSNAALCSGAIVLLRRGKVSFASKAITAQSSGAAALIVCQTFDVWPFVMTDSANELASVELKIPVIMVSHADSLILEKLLSVTTDNGQRSGQKEETSGESNHKQGNREESPSSPSFSCKLVCGRFEEECSICQEIMLEGNTVLKLTCRHAYHADCVQTWLERYVRALFDPSHRYEGYTL